MRVTVTIYPAKNGDCFLVSYGDTSQKHILIDAGYGETVENYLLKDLLGIAAKGESLEKLIVTHIDADHILGVKKLLKQNNKKPLIKIDEIWHNSFRHLFTVTKKKVTVTDEVILERIIQRGYPQQEIDLSGNKPISAKQGTTVGALILQGEYNWNTDFGNSAVSVDVKDEIALGDENKILMLSPDADKLDSLKTFWKDDLLKYGFNYSGDRSTFYDDAFEMLMSWEKQMPKKRPKQIAGSQPTIPELLEQPFDEDSTATNGSSIAFVLSIKEKQLLFLGDAHPDLIVKSLNKWFPEGLATFDVIKVSHHGSFNNISKELLEKIDAPSYIISTNGGRHGHPDQETIAHLIARPTKFVRQLYFNYETSNSEYFNREDWKKQYQYSIHYLNHPPYSLEL